MTIAIPNPPAAALRETKAKGWEIDSRGKVKIVEPIAGEPPDEYYLLASDRVGVVQIREIKKNPEVALVGQILYDNNRRAIKSSWLDKRGKVISTFVYTYDERGLMARREEQSKAGRTLSTTECTCDENGHIVEERYTRGDDFLGRNVYTYGPNGKAATETHFNAKDEAAGTYHLSYDSAGRLSGRAWHNSKGQLMTEFKYTLDPNGNRIRAELHSGGKLETIQEFKYDNRGNLLEERWLEPDGKLTRTFQHRRR
ncbi:MAG: hypothetical protein JXR83_03505 [Deltaproteobacteria bacterium]|nr:hypothetical protein [Deltaproteobacteria bacterium]